MRSFIHLRDSHIRASLHRDIYHPVWQLQTGVAFVLSADWPAPSLPTLASTDNGFLHVRHWHRVVFCCRQMFVRRQLVMVAPPPVEVMLTTRSTEVVLPNVSAPTS